MSLTRETLIKMNKNVLAVMILDYKERFNSTLCTITVELIEISTTNLPSSLFLLIKNVGQINSTLVERTWKYPQFPSLFRMMTWRIVLKIFSINVTPQ